MKIQLLDVDSLDTNVVQPSGRTEPKRLERLMEVLKARGMRKPIAVVCVAGKRLVVVDGHRTLAAWRALGHATIQCCVSNVHSEVEAEAIFAEMNSATQVMPSRAYLYQWANATNGEAQLKAMGRMGYKIRSFIRVFGEKEARIYGKRGDVDPTTAPRAEMVARSIAVYRDVPQSSPAKIGHWIIRHRAMVTVLFVCRYGTARQIKALARAIDGGIPYDIKRPRLRRNRGK